MKATSYRAVNQRAPNRAPPGPRARSSARRIRARISSVTEARPGFPVRSAVLVLRAAPQRRGYEDGQFHACPAWTAPPLVGTYCLS
jgi:hypothetical protein